MQKEEETFIPRSTC